MSLRPRYSLLTLLILTAILAGGVKYWRGPHWRTLSYPLTTTEQRLFDLYPPYPAFRHLTPVNMEYQYRNRLEGPELLVVKYTPTSTSKWRFLVFPCESYFKLLGVNQPQGPPEKDFVFIRTSTQENSSTYVFETIRCWYSIRQAAMNAVGDKYEESGDGWIPLECYFVSDHQYVYKFIHGGSLLGGVRIRVSEIPDNLRTIIEHELASIAKPSMP